MNSYKGSQFAFFKVLLLLFVLLAFAPTLRSQAGWVATDSGKMYSTSAGYLTGFQIIGSSGNKYYFDENGIMQTGFVTVNGKLYYFAASGKMIYGWIQENGKKYYANKSTGVLYVSTWYNNYYFQSDGSLAISTWIGNKWVNSSGKYTGTTKTGWVTFEGNSYYYITAKTCATGWYKISKKTYYFDSDGILQKSCWIGKKYVNSNGVMVTGMKKISGKYYIFKSSGTRYSSTWVSYNGSYYYCNSKGVVQKSTWINNKYVDSDGKMVTGWYTIDGKTYYFSTSDGTMKTGIIKVSKKRYYLTSKGVLKTSCWVKSKYYAGSDGAFLTGLQTISGKIYYFNTSTGKMVTKTLQSVGSDTYYFTVSGYALTSSWLLLNGNYYYFQSDGTIAKSTWVGKYYVNSSGVRTSKTRDVGWYTSSSGKKYYYDSNYEKLTGFQTIGNYTYYFNSKGVMQTGLMTISGKQYYFYSSGIMATSLTIIISNVQYTIDDSGVVTSAVELSDVTLGEEIANYALQFVGNPYVYGGTSLTSGADCSGFTYSVMAYFGIKLLRVANDQMYGPSTTQIKAGYTAAVSVSVDLDSLLPGDLIFYGYSGYATHVGIYIGNGQIVHASNSQAYPAGGIKVSAYNYSTPIAAVRYWS